MSALQQLFDEAESKSSHAAAAGPTEKGIRIPNIDVSKLDLDAIQKLIDTLTPLIPTYGPLVRVALSAILSLLKARKTELTGVAE